MQISARFVENKSDCCSVEPDDEIAVREEEFDIVQCDGDGQTDTEKKGCVHVRVYECVCARVRACDSECARGYDGGWMKQKKKK